MQPVLRLYEDTIAGGAPAMPLAGAAAHDFRGARLGHDRWPHD